MLHFNVLGGYFDKNGDLEGEGAYIDDIRGKNDAGTIASLRVCRLLKLFDMPSMRSQVRFLEYIPRMWNPEKQYFKVGGLIMTKELEDISTFLQVRPGEEHLFI